MYKICAQRNGMNKTRERSNDTTRARHFRLLALVRIFECSQETETQHSQPATVQSIHFVLLTPVPLSFIYFYFSYISLCQLTETRRVPNALHGHCCCTICRDSSTVKSALNTVALNAHRSSIHTLANLNLQSSSFCFFLRRRTSARKMYNQINWHLAYSFSMRTKANHTMPRVACCRTSHNILWLDFNERNYYYYYWNGKIYIPASAWWTTRISALCDPSAIHWLNKNENSSHKHIPIK